MGYVWLEMLSEADRNQGLVKGDRRSIAESYAWLSLSIKPSYYIQAVLRALPYMLDKGWITETEGGFLVRNYGEYHPRREQKESHKGTKQSPSLLPSLTSLPNKQDKGPKGPSSSPPEMTPKEFIESWNEICAPEGLPAVKDLSNGRRKKIQTRLRSFPTVEFWGKVFNGIVDSKFLRGQNKDGWKATIDFVIANDENPLKIVEGAYG